MMADYMKKTKLPTDFRTLKHKCSQCIRNDAEKYPISENEVRWLCPNCVMKNNHRDSRERPHFVRASKLG
jgi:Zn finger protein HypA/HybF involved in hydrogenase expression